MISDLSHTFKCARSVHDSPLRWVRIELVCDERRNCTKKTQEKNCLIVFVDIVRRVDGFIAGMTSPAQWMINVVCILESEWATCQENFHRWVARDSAVNCTVHTANASRIFFFFSSFFDCVSSSHCFQPFAKIVFVKYIAHGLWLSILPEFMCEKTYFAWNRHCTAECGMYGSVCVCEVKLCARAALKSMFMKRERRSRSPLID